MPPKKGKGAAAKKSSSKDSVPPRATRSTRASKKAAEEVTEQVTEEATTSATSVPDIAGVIEEREDEDIAVDATEPPPDDEQEKQRLAQRPPEARDTVEDVPMQTQEESNDIAAQMDPFSIKPTAAASNVDTPADQGSSSSTTALTKEERMDKLNALRKRMVRIHIIPSHQSLSQVTSLYADRLCLGQPPRSGSSTERASQDHIRVEALGAETTTGRSDGGEARRARDGRRFRTQAQLGVLA